MVTTKRPYVFLSSSMIEFSPCEHADAPCHNGQNLLGDPGNKDISGRSYRLRLTIAETLWAFIGEAGGCSLWTGGPIRKGAIEVAPPFREFIGRYWNVAYVPLDWPHRLLHLVCYRQYGSWRIFGRLWRRGELTSGVKAPRHSM